MSNIKSPISSKHDGYSHLNQNYGNIRVENPSNNDYQFRLNYLEKHFNLIEQRIGLVEETQEKVKYSGGADYNTNERIKLLEELILRQKADFNARIGSLEDQLKQLRYTKSEKVEDTISNSRLVSIEIKFEQLERTVRLLNDKYAIHGLEGDNLQVLNEIRKLKEAVEDCIHNQRELEIQNLDIRRQQREVSFDPSHQVKQTITPKKVADRSPGPGSSNKKEGGSGEKTGPYSNLKNKYGNKSKELSTEPDIHNSGSKNEKIYENIEALKKIIKEEKQRPKSALKSNESSKSPVKVKKSPNKSFSQLTPDTSLTTISPGHKKKSSANLQTASFDNRSDLEIALEAKRRLIDQEIEKRINEQFAERKKIEAAVHHNHKVTDKLHNQDEDFRITPMSTEKSREKEVQNRLAREKKLRGEIIDKFANAVPDKRKVR